VFTKEHPSANNCLLNSFRQVNINRQGQTNLSTLKPFFFASPNHRRRGGLPFSSVPDLPSHILRLGPSGWMAGPEEPSRSLRSLREIIPNCALQMREINHLRRTIRPSWVAPASRGFMLASRRHVPCKKSTTHADPLGVQALACFASSREPRLRPEFPITRRGKSTTCVEPSARPG
jgi:hypothetical protein